MKKTLGELLDPSFDHYRSIGELAKTLSFLMTNAQQYRDKGEWGESGIHETLVNYRSCVNCLSHNWHSSRITTQSETTTWQQNHDTIYECILGSLCATFPSACKWRACHEIGLDMLLKFPMAYQNQEKERNAWDALMSLHKHVLPVKSLNTCHRGVNVLADPQLIISKDSIHIAVAVTLKSELRESARCYSRWDYSFLTRTAPNKWNCQRETFAEFVLRSVAFYKREDAKPRGES